MSVLNQAYAPRMEKAKGRKRVNVVRGRGIGRKRLQTTDQGLKTQGPGRECGVQDGLQRSGFMIWPPTPGNVLATIQLLSYCFG